MAFFETLKFLIFLRLLFLNHVLTNGLTFDIVSLGAKPDGKTDASFALQTAWTKACGSSTPATIYVPNGTFYVKSGSFNGPCENNAITISINGTLVASSDMTVLAHTKAWIWFKNVNGLSIFGGVLDGQGKDLWNCKHAKENCPDGVTVCKI